MIKEMIIEELEYIKQKTLAIEKVCAACNTPYQCDNCSTLGYIIDLTLAQDDIEEEVNELQGKNK
jgi:hypothetical protein